MNEAFHIRKNVLDFTFKNKKNEPTNHNKEGNFMFAKDMCYKHDCQPQKSHQLRDLHFK
jgi:hypothetical protein